MKWLVNKASNPDRSEPFKVPFADDYAQIVNQYAGKISRNLDFGGRKKDTISNKSCMEILSADLSKQNRR